jgi:hypothetical protein
MNWDFLLVRLKNPSRVYLILPVPDYVKCACRKHSPEAAPGISIAVFGGIGANSWNIRTYLVTAADDAGPRLAMLPPLDWRRKSRL